MCRRQEEHYPRAANLGLGSRFVTFPPPSQAVGSNFISRSDDQTRKGCCAKWKGGAANVHCRNPEPSMSQMGQTRPFGMSTGCPVCSEADMGGAIYEYPPSVRPRQNPASRSNARPA